MSDDVMDLWDYRQALYCDAAKWVCGDIGKPRPGGQVRDEHWAECRLGDYRRSVDLAASHGATHGAYAPGSIAGIGYGFQFGRRKAFYSGNYGGRYGSE